MKIKILVCYHKISPILSLPFLQPILVGAKKSNKNTIKELSKACKRKNINLLKDDEGSDNISELNPYFCELTALYWAWKNLEADYYGLFHYRRIFKFKAINPMFKTLHWLRLDKFYLKKMILKYDIIIPEKNTLEQICKDLSDCKSWFNQYNKEHYGKDLQICLDYINERYPNMRDCINKTMYNKDYALSFCNMFIVKKELFFEYCEWLFDILFYVKDKIDYKEYNTYQARVFGFLSERLFNIWFEYKKTGLRYLEIPIVNLENKRPFFGCQEDGKIKRYYFCKLRILKIKKTSN